ncbi:hypothetical protein [Sediminicola luteus]|uniref:Uncharacterized protein n=1 Tax=Sediminicola luteus TaxID=319238 RepID=A0A2A4G8V4_9FLAO|nr:hypothetical protein [Sediminicola luteus]PCE64400.1 hypothetical protein B7P33_08905 [Sediminicola luteus]
MRNVILFLLMGALQFGFAQSKRIQKFEKTLADFRYGLNADLARMDVDRMRQMTYLSNDTISERAGRFVLDNTDVIVERRQWQLQQMAPFSESKIEGYTPVDEIDIMDLRREFDGMPEALLQYVRLDTEMYITAQMHMVIGQLGIDPMVQFSMMNSIAAARYYAEEVKDGVWSVRFDNYLYLGDFELTVATGEAVFSALWKKDNP